MQNTTELTNSSFLPKKEFPIQGMVALAACFTFLYINLIMLFTLRSKVMFCETPRYILFTHLLSCDSLQLACTSVFYIFFHTPMSASEGYVVSYICFLLYLICRITNNYLSPVFLVLMSLERYVAICFPLRHGEIANKTRAVLAVTVVWSVGLITLTLELTVAFAAEAGSQVKTCSDFIVSQPQISYTTNNAILGIIFSTVSITIIYVYIAILITAKSAASEKTSDSKAHKTVLLHMAQLGLYVFSLFYGVMRRALFLSNLPPKVALELINFFFILLNILPRCLSPLIYGLRDKAFCIFFRQNLFFCITNTAKTKVALVST